MPGILHARLALSQVGKVGLCFSGKCSSESPIIIVIAGNTLEAIKNGLVGLHLRPNFFGLLLAEIACCAPDASQDLFCSIACHWSSLHFLIFFPVGLPGG